MSPQISHKPHAKLVRARSQSARTKLHKRAARIRADFESNDESNSSIVSSNNIINRKPKNAANTHHRHNNQLNRNKSIESDESTNTLTSKGNRSNNSNVDVPETWTNPIKFSCSSSLIDLCTLIFRYRDACQSLIEMIIPVEWLKHNQKFFQAKFNCVNNMFQVVF